MAINNNSGEEDAEKSSRNIAIKSPRVEKEQPRSIVLWGNFEGLDEKICGAFYCEIPPDDYEFSKFAVALFSDSESLRQFEMPSPPSQFQEKVEKRFGPHGDLKKSDVNMAFSTFENYLLDHSQKENFFSWVENEDKKQLVDYIDQLITEIIRKGRIKFNIAVMLFTPGKLKRNKSDKEEADIPDQRESSHPPPGNDLDDSRNYHRAKIVTIPLKGVSPKELQPGDEIYARARGELANKFPDDMQSDKHDNMTAPLEAVVKSVSLNPRLPADHDGNPADYIEIKAQLEEGSYIQGFVFKDETVKPVGELEGDGPDIIFIVGLFIASGLTLLFLALAAWFIFG